LLREKKDIDLETIKLSISTFIWAAHWPNRLTPLFEYFKRQESIERFDDKILKYSKSGVNRFGQWAAHICIYIYVHCIQT